MLEVVGPGRTRAALGLPASRMQSGSSAHQARGREASKIRRAAHRVLLTHLATRGRVRAGDLTEIVAPHGVAARCECPHVSAGAVLAGDKSEWKGSSGSSQLWQSRSVWTMVPQTGGGRAAPVTTPLVSPLWLGFVPLDVFIQQVLLG